jgi:uncharacterized membrane protein YbhN (UPF0104 family)
MTTYTAPPLAPGTTGARPQWRRWARLVGGAAVLGVVVWRIGSGPFVDGLRMVSARSLVLAFCIGVVTTVCCAWRWCLVARGLGVRVSMREAVPAYYRSQFLNSTLPGGVVGDVHRAVAHGRDAGDLGGSARAVALERTVGQMVQIAITVVLLLLLPSPVHGSMPFVAVGLLTAALIVAAATRLLPRASESRWARAARTLLPDVRRGIVARDALPGIVLASTVVVAGNTALLLAAGRTAGLQTATAQLLPLALLVLLAMAVPISIGGWGPREGAAAWAFALAGLGAAAGVTTAVIYGVLALVASLPGAIVLVADWQPRSASRAERGNHD